MGLSEDDSWQELEPGWRETVETEGRNILNVFLTVAMELHVVEPFFSFLQEGKKTVEGRCNVGKYAEVKEGQFLFFNDSLLLRVETIKKYCSFQEMLETEEISSVLPGIKSVEEGLKIYRQFYYEEKERTNGVVAFHVTHFSEPLGKPLLECMNTIMESLGINGVRVLLRLRRTLGSIPNAVPPSPRLLIKSFCEPLRPKLVLSVGARALAKHSHRSEKGWWGECKGSEAKVNLSSLEVLHRIMKNCVWINIHCLPHDVPFFEIRVRDGYGARWSLDGSQFRGFLEPPMEDGHEKHWRH